MNTIPWSEIKHKASPEDREAARKAAQAEAAEMLRRMSEQNAGPEDLSASDTEAAAA